MKIIPLAVLACGTAFASVDSGLLNLVMPDATSLAGAQVIQAQASPLGQFIISKIQTDAGFTKLLTLTGFDPRHDLQEVLAASTGAGPGSLVLVKGTFQPSKISAAAVQSGATTSQYRSIELLSQKDATSIAFLDNFTVVIGETPAVKAAIDRKSSGSTFSGELAKKAQAASAANQVWFASTNPPTSLLGNNLPNANLLQAVLQTTAGASFSTTGVTLSADLGMRSAQDAQSLVDVVKFLKGMIPPSQNGGAPNPAAALLNNATVNAAGSSVQLGLMVPELQAEQLLMPHTRASAR